MGTAAKRSKARLEARIDRDLDVIIGEAADRMHLTKTAFITDTLREAALKVVTRAEVTLMDAGVFDSMMASIDTADPSPELDSLAAMPRLIGR